MSSNVFFFPKCVIIKLLQMVFPSLTREGTIVATFGWNNCGSIVCVTNKSETGKCLKKFVLMTHDPASLFVEGFLMMVRCL